MDEQKLAELKKRIENGKMTKYKAETRLEELEKQEKILSDEIIKLGYNPSELDAVIQKLEKEKEELRSKILELLPSEIPNL
ncbi:hypothetical protein [Alkalithermobacter paradoxus]|uniref:Uncharacterized protein n=1 Tax=Alkalithermobacter paradoxus TaxID=29349 RepID=A0A1V4I656_9FIRM|nr:hypothetical protein CLOTH_17600 [[Clostridium] thermoalcaliphilum]